MSEAEEMTQHSESSTQLQPQVLTNKSNSAGQARGYLIALVQEGGRMRAFGK